MAHYMAINKSGKNLPIFSGWPSVDKGNQIGTIYNREAFIYSDTEDGVEVYFRNSSGRIVQGFYYATDANGNDLFSSNAEAMKALSSCIDYPFSTVTIGEFTFSCRNYPLYNRLASHKTNRRVNTQLGVIPREQGHHVLQFSKEELL